MVLLIILAKQRLHAVYDTYVVMVISKYYLLFHAIYDSYVVIAISKYLLFHD